MDYLDVLCSQRHALFVAIPAAHHILDGRYKKRKQIALHVKGGRGQCIREKDLAGLLFSLHLKKRGTFMKQGWVLQEGDI